MTRQKELIKDMVQNIFLRMLKFPEGFMGFGEQEDIYVKKAGK
jgi:hypothetical protein